MIGACILGGSAQGVVATFGGGRVRSDNRSEGLRRPNGVFFSRVREGKGGREKSFLIFVFCCRIGCPGLVTRMGDW